AHSCFQYAIQK
nr:NADP-specific isocitrate dehydrogenase peptide IV [swine, heart, Peptide Partial, 11 aa] [Sus scrofa]